MPVGGWAKLTQIQAGLWDEFMPRPVKLPVEHFAERDVAGHLQWFEVTRGQLIQGCVVRGQTRTPRICGDAGQFADGDGIRALATGGFFWFVTNGM